MNPQSYALMLILLCSSAPSLAAGVEKLYPVKKGGKYGYVDHNGTVVVPIELDWAVEFYERRGTFGKSRNQVGVLDAKGRVTFTLEVEALLPFSNDRALICHGFTTVGFVNERGEPVIAEHDVAAQVGAKSVHLTSFSDGLAAFGAGGRTGFIDTNGRVVIAPRYSSAGHFSEGLCPVEFNGRWGCIDKSGRLVIEAEYEHVSSPSDSVIVAKTKGQSWLLLSLDGQSIGEVHAKNVLPFSVGFAPIQDKGGKWGFIGKNGKLQIRSQFDEVLWFSNGLAPVKVDGRWGYIDTESRVVIQPKFLEAHPHDINGVAWVRTAAGHGYINLKGDFVWTPQM
ncbi:MAG: WG repeat-containing protein [Phycisphaeraceae bacterium]